MEIQQDPSDEGTVKSVNNIELAQNQENIQQQAPGKYRNQQEIQKKYADFQRRLNAAQKEDRDKKAEIYQLKQLKQSILKSIDELQKKTQIPLINIQQIEEAILFDKTDQQSYEEDQKNFQILSQEIDNLYSKQRDFDKFKEPFIQVNFQRLEDIAQGFDLKYNIDVENIQKLVESKKPNDPQNDQNIPEQQSDKELEEQQITNQIMNLRESAQYVIGTVGFYKKGKSYFMSKIADQNFKQGQLEKTEGLNFLLHGQGQQLFIDTQGHSEPIQCFKTLQTYRQQLEKQKIEDGLVKGPDQQWIGPPKLDVTQKQEEIETNVLRELNYMTWNKKNLYDSSTIMERFIHTFVLKVSHILILMVGQMTSDEERMINQIMRTQKNRLLETQMIVVHNFQHLTKIDEVKAQIEKNIISCFPVQWEAKNVIKEDQFYTFCYEDYTNSNQKPVKHCVLAHEGTEAGDAFNQKTIDYIKIEIKQINSKLKKMTIEDRLCDFLTDNLSQYLLAKPKQPSSMDLKQLREQIERQIQQQSEECDLLNKQIKRSEADRQKEEKDIKARVDQGIFNYKTLYKPDFRKQKGRIICPLLSRTDKIEIIKKPPITTISGDDIDPPVVGSVKPDYCAIDFRDKREMNFYFDVSCINPIKISRGTTKISGANKQCLIFQAKKKLPEDIEILTETKNEQGKIVNDKIVVPTKISENGQRNIQEGIINEKIILDQDQESQINWSSDKFPVFQLYGNGILQVKLKYTLTNDDEFMNEDDEQLNF